MDTKYLITTRPEIKFNKIYTENIKIINFPLTEIVDIKLDKEIINEIKNNNYEIIILTSSYGAETFFNNYYKYTKKVMFIPIGNKTLDVIKKYNNNYIIPDEKDSYGIINIIKNYKDKKIALFRSKKSNNILSNYLKNNNYNFYEYYIYDIKNIYDSKIIDLINNDNCIGILFTSSLEANVFFDILKNKKTDKKFFSIGKITEKTINDHGYKTDFTGNSNFEETIKEIDKNSGEWI